MNGSRSNPSRQSDRTSLDALNRTIEGLEARIEGLMGSGRDQRTRTPTAERDPYAGSNAPRPTRAPLEPRPDPLAEIRQRQRALEAGRERSYGREQATQLRDPAPRATAPLSAPALRAGDDTMTEIAQALVNLRQDLKRDISEGVTREMSALRAELREIKATAGDSRFADDIRADMNRLAQSISQLTGRSSGPEAAGLREDFEELRSLMDGLAREESLRHMENRWDGVESRLAALDTEGLQEELVSLAYRLDDIKRHLGGMDESPAVRALEDKLIAIATAMEQFGNMIQPHDRIMSEQFAAMDTRLDEISRAIAASGRAAAGNDPTLLQRLESRLSSLADQIDMMSHDAASRANPADELAMRLEALTERVEELTKAEATSRLDERLEHLSYLLERTQKAAAQPDLTGPLSDISRKIDALENGAVNDVLAQRLDYLARRIDEMAYQQPAPAAAIDDRAFQRLEGRLSDIAARLEETTAAAPTDPRALKNLEDQIANLSALMSEPRESAAIPADFDRRMGAIEDYMATSDEYIIEAARQAAEAVVEAYSRNGGLQGGVPAADMSALAALAEDLRHLEDISRDSEERTHKTFKALHETLVHIADRLDGMEERGRPVAQMPMADVDFDVDPYALMVAEAARAPDAAPATKASPVIRTAEVAAEPAAPVQAAAMSATSAIAIEAATRTPETPTPAPVKTSLLASLGKRLRPAKKAEAQANERPMIDPAPSIDPADVVQTDAANELLEPGSGAPDVKKILERVRASQSAQRGKPTVEADRADYIAAARRAAQAAAMEVDANPKQAAKAEKKAANAAKAGKIGKTGKTSAFSRYRRPILLAVGAVLLAIMAFPLARTLTSGEPAPQSPAEVSVLTGAMDNPQPVPPEATPAQPDTGAADMNAAATTSAPATDQAQPETTPPAAGDHLTDAMPLDGEGAATFAPAGSSVATQETSSFTANSPIAAAPGPQAAITIPESVQPKSLADAAQSGDALALFEIGARYSDGRNGMTVDQKQAAGWYQLAADKGFAPAQYRLGSMYEKGNGVERDIAKAKGFYEQAANQGNASAMHNLAVLYASGALGQQDYATAASWFTKAANLGITDSQFNLAILCARGNGVPADLEESYKWFAIAAKAGDKDAAQKRDEVAKAMKPDQLERARAKADLWKPEPLDHRANGIDIPDEWAGTGMKTATVDMKKAIRNIQAILNNNGFDAGVPDGEMGAKTVTAIKNFQKSIGQEPDGKVSDATVKALLERNKQVAKAI
ncbi:MULTISPECIES: peptidoglycan-binding protein [Rhizobium]|uniref:peptidoglycan-binding protein n=1 Tax=Rhizobium TaxID=379 RepID=UPI0007EB8DCE|nr:MULTISPECIES: peptidoglycan-binding protein [Rhizobium]ANK90109.1 peptidoglycan-binding domain-containing protein [Rhizobium sp. N6212]ANK96136.1 peptidoglycan-binding domain-containing protein [Rhizobium sp. N621]ANL02164.1 peptidoglycan-binding domain-containing protein [Rhizobium esperanzae]ANL08292.1 peptidoglycan-binding domain-containing protein [Rhizobium sp. N1341]ANL20341.1 peptidoglycan-binding domain-containing protein [Rhizobium sp. N113]